ncbi:TetR family transcriptional regulator [Brachyspira hyodysenteriae]|uniref:TetR/AcrR family transcriptional regulator n=1 Tax=Brachyspira hyodysenteriae TaxID=159 RepID=UPI00063DB6F0|nr:TetR/AcrR family transcriptional regulator [Brachyspira hyodysenteriae]KLI48053.1 TetR family transcriptional regulator [Brachyspira hyodysenteriae]KLI53080.1 TetR family transcriptional regulator [Brachyspira hyodysenteriae]MCZ9938007.1 TetR/AcrR family transcriptional regulator [Brachyspira hyodysenteriae]MCZ9955105.1 TetR/AcrR family transcriptional regulator [Brachyspira hyodysenteriae]QTM02388.1 TetR family transcriptional regulator [Brachyspira hyodysenteriae]
MSKNSNIPEDKREAIINASIDEFAKHEYKHAILENISNNANISKSLLLYHFKSKKNLYAYIYDYVCEYLESMVADSDFYKITDFFELMEYSFYKKLEMMEKYKSIFDFILQGYFDESEDVKEIVNKYRDKKQIDIAAYFKNIDTTKFKDDVNMQDIIQMITYTSEGYLQSRKNMSIKIDKDDMIKQYSKWMKMFKQISYKEEYL